MNLVRAMSDQRGREKKDMIFEAEVSVPDRMGTWLKDGEVIEANSRVKMSTKATVHRLVIKNSRSDDTGEYTLLVDYVMTSAQLELEGYYYFIMNNIVKII